MRTKAIRWGALAIGVILFSAALYYINVDLAVDAIRQLGLALPLAIFFSGLWHLARTWAWAWCFPQPRTVSFLRLARVRLSAEAFSYLTLRGIAGEPLKVVLLADRVDTREAAAAVALERIAYLVGTTVIVGIGSLAALIALPLTRPWFRVFRAFVIVALAATVLTALVIRGRGTYLQSLLQHIDRILGTSISSGRISRFAGAVESQVLELVRGNPVRLVVLLAATALSYVFMALEAWVILSASGAPITPVGALAVETFTRVASFASAFIPANLGALEASSLAAVAAVGALGGGAALAIARRLRGLFWAGIGLAIYPRSVKPKAATPEDLSVPRQARPRAMLLYFPHDAHDRTRHQAPSTPHAAPSTQHTAPRPPHPAPSTRLAGLPLVERVIRSAVRAGYGHIVVSTADATHETIRQLDTLARSFPEVVLVSTDHEWRTEIEGTGGNAFVTAIGPGTIVSPALHEAAIAIAPDRGEVWDVPAGPQWPESGVLRMSIDQAVDREKVAAALRLRRDRALPLPSGEDIAAGRAKLALRIVTHADLAAAEATIRRASYKDTDNTLARFNRRTSLPISVALIRTPLTPNQLSVMLVAIGFYSAWLFSLGHYVAGVLGAFLSLAASVLDGCDGEIARLKYQESALGCWIETFGDYSYYIAIFVGLTIGAVRQTHLDAFYWIGALALAGTLLSFVLLIYLRSRITSGRPERLHAIAGERFRSDPTVWSRIVWRLSFTATRSAMPYGIFVFSLINALPAIVVLAAIGANTYWISLVLKLKHLLRDDCEPVKLGNW